MQQLPYAQDYGSTKAVCGVKKQSLQNGSWKSTHCRPNSVASKKELQDTSAKNASTIDSDSLRCVEQFYHSQIAIIDRISAEYFEKKDAAIPIRLTILQQLDISLHSMQTPQTSDAIISLVNLHHNDILANIKSEMPKLKPTDIEFMALKLAGFSPKAIALFQGLTLGNYYNRWTRLRARIGNYDAAHKEQILSLLNATVKSH